MSARPRRPAWNPAALLGGLLLVLSAATLSAQTGGESAYERVLKDLVGALDGVTKVFAGVTNEASARAAVPEAKKAVNQLKEVQKKAEELPQPDKAEKDRVTRLYRSKLQESLNKLSSEIARVKSMPGGSDLAALLKPVQSPKEDKATRKQGSP